MLLYFESIVGVLMFTGETFALYTHAEHGLFTHMITKSASIMCYCMSVAEQMNCFLCYTCTHRYFPSLATVLNTLYHIISFIPDPALIYTHMHSLSRMT